MGSSFLGKSTWALAEQWSSLAVSDSISWPVPSLAEEQKGLDQTKVGQQDCEGMERFLN